MDKFDILIIGSGLGGLLCGYILSKEGFSVCILEKHSQPGGNLQTFTRHGHKFETGVHYIGALGPGQTLSRYWSYFGLMNDLPLQRLDPDGFDRIAFGDDEFRIAQGFGNFRERMLQHFPGEKTRIDEYIRKIHEVVSAFPLYNLELPVDHREHHYTTHSAREFFENLTHLPDPAHQLSDTGYPIPLSSALAGNNYLYGGSSLTPLHVASLINHSFISGAYRIIGGSDKVSQSLVQSITLRGGTVLTRHEVSGIERLKQKFTVKTANGGLFLASMVIANIHPSSALSLMPPEIVRPAYQNRIASLQNTASAFMLFLSLKPGTFPYLNYNYYCHSTPDPWDEGEASGGQWPRMFLLSTGCHDPGQKYAETVTILTYMRFEEVARWKDTTTGKRGQDYIEFKDQMANRLLTRVSEKFPELVQAIAHLDISTPLTCRDYTGNAEGSLYGIQKNFHDPLLTTVMPKTKIPNFYFTGQNTNLHGVLGVTIGSVVTCGEILGLDYLLKKIQHV